MKLIFGEVVVLCTESTSNNLIDSALKDVPLTSNYSGVRVSGRYPFMLTVDYIGHGHNTDTGLLGYVF